MTDDADWSGPHSFYKHTMICSRCGTTAQLWSEGVAPECEYRAPQPAADDFREIAQRMKEIEAERAASSEASVAFLRKWEAVFGQMVEALRRDPSIKGKYRKWGTE